MARNESMVNWTAKLRAQQATRAKQRTDKLERLLGAARTDDARLLKLASELMRAYGDIPRALGDDASSFYVHSVATLLEGLASRAKRKQDR